MRCPAMLASLFLLLAAHAEAQAPRPAPSSIDLGRPMKWLISSQHRTGGWGEEAGSPPDVATTSLAGIALLRYGHTYAVGEHREALRRALTYVVAAVEHAPPDAVAIQPEGTQPQRKLGRYIDTYLAAQFLGEALPTINDLDFRGRVGTALDAIVGKVLKLQRKDGSFDGQGWAPVLSSAFATGGLYAAQRAGSAAVKQNVLQFAQRHMAQQYDARAQAFRTDSSAGVELYSAAGALATAANAGEVNEAPARAARKRITDESFVRGFGSYGGEEHVSYMMTSEALAKVGGTEWAQWNASVRKRLAATQREGGTWRGDHCITSTSFCTAASLITLAIKPPVPPVAGRRSSDSL